MSFVDRYEDLDHRTKHIVITFFSRFTTQSLVVEKERVSSAFFTWRDAILELRKHALVTEQRERALEVLRFSSRGARSAMEKEILRRYIVAQLTCIPKSMTNSEMDKMCNELDWYPLIGRSIIFLQGDFGNVYYMIARGTVGLFLEPSKDKEMSIARQYGNLRGQPFMGTDEDLKGLGNNIFNLPVSTPYCTFSVSIV
jgi:hypothetical protein